MDDRVAGVYGSRAEALKAGIPPENLVRVPPMRLRSDRKKRGRTRGTGAAAKILRRRASTGR
jgi:hypothetical protein